MTDVISSHPHKPGRTVLTGLRNMILVGIVGPLAFLGAAYQLGTQELPSVGPATPSDTEVAGPTDNGAEWERMQTYVETHNCEPISNTTHGYPEYGAVMTANSFSIVKFGDIKFSPDLTEASVGSSSGYSYRVWPQYWCYDKGR